MHGVCTLAMYSGSTVKALSTGFSYSVLFSPIVTELCTSVLPSQFKKHVSLYLQCAFRICCFVVISDEKLLPAPVHGHFLLIPTSWPLVRIIPHVPVRGQLLFPTVFLHPEGVR